MLEAGAVRGILEEVSRIYLASHEFYPQHGGIATFTEELAAAFGQAGEAVTVLAPRASRNPLQEPLFEVESFAFPANHGWRAIVGMARELVRRRKELQQGVLCITEPGPLWAFYLAARLTGLRVPRLWVVVHGSEVVRGTRARGWRRVLEFAFGNAQRIATVSRYTQGLLCENFSLPSSRVTVLPIGPASHMRAAGSGVLRAKPAAGRPLVLLTVARLHPRKGQDLVLQALARLDPARRRGVQYRIVGGGRRAGYGKRLRQMAGDLKLPVVFTGPLDERALQLEYAGADLFALTSRTHKQSVEGFGLVYLEAGCFSLPVVGTRSGGTSDAIHDGKTGYLVPEGDVDAIAAALDRLLGDRGLRATLGAAGQVLAGQRSWDKVAAALTHPADGQATGAIPRQIGDTGRR